MLKGLDPLLSPDLLHVLAQMGHGDQIALVDRPGVVPEVQQEVFSLARSVEDRDIGIERVERFAFYERARQAFAVVATSEARPYGCVILTKGVIF